MRSNCFKIQNAKQSNDLVASKSNTVQLSDTDNKPDHYKSPCGFINECLHHDGLTAVQWGNVQFTLASNYNVQYYTMYL